MSERSVTVVNGVRKAFKWLVIAAVVVAAVLLGIYLHGDDNKAETRDMTELSARGFTDIVVIDAPKNAARFMPFMQDSLQISGTYSAKAGGCRFTLKFANGRPVAEVDANTNSVLTVNDADFTRLSRTPEVASRCF